MDFGGWAGAHQRCINKPAQGNALGKTDKRDPALIGKSSLIYSDGGFCGEGLEAIAHGFSGLGQTCVLTLEVMFFESGEDGFIISFAGGHQRIDDPGQEVGHGGECFGCTKVGAQAAIARPEHTFLAMEADAGLAQGSSQPGFAASTASVHDLPAGNFGIGAEPQPADEVVDRPKATEVRTDFA